jgi:hypothetical protein
MPTGLKEAYPPSRHCRISRTRYISPRCATARIARRPADDLTWTSRTFAGDGGNSATTVDDAVPLATAGAV